MKLLVLLVTNTRYLKRCFHTIWQLRLFGRYFGEVAVIVGDDLREQQLDIASSFLRVHPLYFPDLPMAAHEAALSNASGVGGMEKKKLFQYHKFHVFSTKFQDYRKVLYLDSGIQIMHPISPILGLDTKGKIVAHSDAFPSFESTLESQFNFVDFPSSRTEMNAIANLNSDYFQTSMMLFDPKVSTDHSIAELEDLRQRFPNSKTNDQGIINLWALERGLWKVLPTGIDPHSALRMYDFYERAGLSRADYVMLKYPRSKQRMRDRLSERLFELYWHLFSKNL